MGASKHIKMIMLDRSIDISQLAELLKINKQSVSNKLHRDTMSFSDAEKIAELLNCEIVFRDKETGKYY